MKSSDVEKSDLRKLAKHYRRALDSSDFSMNRIGEEGNCRVGSFPHAACSEVSEMFGIWLAEAHGITPLFTVHAQIEQGRKWYGTHRWLEYNGIILDLTADQFSRELGFPIPPVIVETETRFHREYTAKIFRQLVYYKQDELLVWMKAIYQEIASHL